MHKKQIALSRPIPEFRPETTLPDTFKSTLETFKKYTTLREKINAIYEWKNESEGNPRPHKWIHQCLDERDNPIKRIGNNTVKRILESRELLGCHDHGLLMVSILNALSIPSRLVETVEESWLLRKHANKAEKGHPGHIFVEYFDSAQQKWFLIDSTDNRPVRLDAARQDRFIRPQYDKETDSYYDVCYVLMGKGVRPPDYGVNSVRDMIDMMDSFAENYH